MADTFLTAEWRQLAMLNYRVDPALLAPLVPAGVELDFFKGKTYISLVGFLFLGTKVRGFGVPMHRDFEEVNLRFYVRRKHEDVVRRGVVFIREIVPRHAIAAIARWVFNENYIRLPMSHRVEANLVEYGWRIGRDWNSMRVETEGEGALAKEGSEEQFITEHYWGYTAQRDGGCLEYEVRHEPWSAINAQKACFLGDSTALYGAKFATILAQEPDSAFLADGSPVTVFQGRRIC